MNTRNRSEVLSEGPTEFKPGMDPHARDIVRGDKVIGSLQWHPGSRPRVVFNTDESPLFEIPVSVLEEIVTQMRGINESR